MEGHLTVPSSFTRGYQLPLEPGGRRGSGPLHEGLRCCAHSAPTAATVLVFHGSAASALI